jgi:hypothetical protein
MKIRGPYLAGFFAAVLVLTHRGVAQREEPSGQAAVQATSQTVSQSAASANPAAVAANTEITAALESTVDVRKAKQGDEVVARVTKDVKQEGRVVVQKGDRLIGRILAVKGAGTAAWESRLSAQFDQLKRADATSQLHAVITAVLSVPGTSGAESPGIQGPSGMSEPPRAGGSAAGGGGLLGGVGSGVGSTLGATGSAVGGLGSATDAAFGATTGIGVATPARTIRVESQGTASQSSNLHSVLSTRQGNLRLESGTTLQFRVVGAAEKPAQK